jgi:hypothetical protein
MATTLNALCAFFAVCAAIAWVISSRTKVIYTGQPSQLRAGQSRPMLPDPAFLYGLTRDGRQIDLMPTLRAQSKWNGYAAALAAAAALCQALAASQMIFR